MGAPKADVLLGQKTFLQRVRDAAESVFEEVVAVERHGRAGVEGMRTIFESEHPGSGAMFGLERAMDDSREERLWLTAVDYPLLTSELLADLKLRFEKSRGALLVPIAGGHPQMLCAGYSRRLLPLLRSLIATGDYRMRGLLEAGAELVEESAWRADHGGEPLLNVNDPTTLEIARRLHEREADAHR